MKTAYKLTNSKMRTHKGFQWELGKWYETMGRWSLCSPGWFHFYNDPLVGMFMNPIHANIKNPRLFRAEVEGKFLDDNGTRYGYSRARLIEELPVPQISPVQRVRFAIFCVKEVYKTKKWNKWADNWLSGKDRTIDTAWNTNSNFYTFYTPRATSVVTATESAFYAVESAASAVSVKNKKNAPGNAANAANSAVRSATKNKKIDLIRIARKAMKE